MQTANCWPLLLLLKLSLRLTAVLGLVATPGFELQQGQKNGLCCPAGGMVPPLTTVPERAPSSHSKLNVSEGWRVRNGGFPSLRHP